MGDGESTMGEGPGLNPAFWQDRPVLLTGHTGFKGAWTAALLTRLGARVTGVALEPEGEHSLWRAFSGRLGVDEIISDIRNGERLREIVRDAMPQIVIHMAAQSQVRRGFERPAETHAVNVMGTVNLLEAVRALNCAQVVLVVTSDKVYADSARGDPCKETDRLGGRDPYSASKAAAEIVVRCYSESFFAPRGVALATARGGNVLGGGDFASDRLVPDMFRAAVAGRPATLRYPQARRPWQYVLDCICGYLRYVEYLHGRGAADPPALNFGPLDASGTTVAQIADLMGRHLGLSVPWQTAQEENPPEQMQLKLDCNLAREVLGFAPRLSAAETIAWTADWYGAYIKGADPLGLVTADINRYLSNAA
jgi:CDP-glucose 4,6-dehydratase